ncbi:LINE-1 reverse transcriptase [Orchesella cincta]|uniref:LINE-1 reverse transcriptase n=1 Tax=Orchesella cincta TaxID=48709 RepID=A0A1D2M9L2_ORCCI|nr:LINE-1 reverse transcriptase [Orchesella cincta]
MGKKEHAQAPFYINEDHHKRTRNRRRDLIKAAKAAEEKGKTAKIIWKRSEVTIDGIAHRIIDGELVQVNREAPTLIMGDFNARIANLNFNAETRESKDNKTNQRGKKIIQEIVNYKLCNGVCTGDEEGECTFVNGNGSSVVDLCLVKRNDFVNVTSFQVLVSEHSHHTPIKVTFGKSNAIAQSTKIPRIKWKSEFRYKFQQQLYSQRGEVSMQSFDTLCDILYKSAKAAGLKTEVRLGVQSNSPMWCDTELNKLKANYRRRVQHFRRSNPLRDYDKFIFCKNAMLRAKSEYLEVTLKKKETFFNELYRKLVKCNDSKSFWSAINIYRNGKQTSWVQNDIKLSQWRQHFSSVFTETETTSEQSNCVESHDRLDDEQLDKEFNMFELCIALKKLSTEKAPGSDGICNEVWKNLTLGGDINLPSNYRPISLLNTVTKLFTSMLVKRLDSWCKKHKKISEYQAGFKTDLSQAFDSVNHRILWEKLAKKGLSFKFISLIKQLYATANAKVRCGGEFSEPFKITKSVLQGESLSPKLFTLFLDDIVDDIGKSDASSIRIGTHDVDMLLFADDIALIAISARDLQNKINIMKEYFEKNNLRENLMSPVIILLKKLKTLKTL